MTQKKQAGKAARNHYSEDYKRESLALADKVGVAAAARELGLEPSKIYAWRSQARRLESRSEAEQRLSVENARLKRQLAEREEELAILKKATAYFARNLK
jgi:transposase